tara:strand:+ start:589 stop:786 length:198 start_codon:yes stop_codon:yes gene_type:complete
MKILHRLPLDEWFDDVPHPHDSMPVATDKGELPDTIENTMHEKMYQIATAKYNPFAIGGSESLHK